MYVQKRNAKTEHRHLGVFMLILLVAVSVTSASYQGPPPGYSQQPPQQYHQQGGQDPYSAQHQQGYPQGQQYPPQQQRPGQQYSVTPYGQRYEQQGSGVAGGFFSKLKSSILAAGSAIAGADGFGPETQGPPLRKPAGPQQYGAPLQRPNPQGPGGSRPPGYGPPTQHNGPQRSGMGNQNEEGGGLMSKLKNFFAAGDEGSVEGPRHPNSPGPSGSHMGPKNSRTGPPPGFAHRPQQGLGNAQGQPPQPPPPYGSIQKGYVGGYPLDDPFATSSPPPMPQQQQQQQQYAPQQQPPPQPWGDEPMIQDIHPQTYGQQPETFYPSSSEQQGVSIAYKNNILIVVHNYLCVT
jgi:hypothetical protein